VTPPALFRRILERPPRGHRRVAGEARRIPGAGIDAATAPTRIRARGARGRAAQALDLGEGEPDRARTTRARATVAGAGTAPRPVLAACAELGSRWRVASGDTLVRAGRDRLVTADVTGLRCQRLAVHAACLAPTPAREASRERVVAPAPAIEAAGIAVLEHRRTGLRSATATAPDHHERHDESNEVHGRAPSRNCASCNTRSPWAWARQTATSVPRCTGCSHPCREGH